MESFPDGTKFRFAWRPYQERILKQLEEYLDDDHLHVVAAPGSGKTVLGLEVVRRLNRPTLVLAPTLAIRDQWITRLVELFLVPSEEMPDWISTDIKEPGFFTVSTYQALHMAVSGFDDFLAEEEENDRDEDEPQTDARGSRQEKVDVAAKMSERGVRTIVVDEAHHLRAAWWHSLVDVVEQLENATIVALTATPPYDVSITEWERYLSLCGPVDEEVSVPELVLQKNLCPHQDLVLLTTPSFSEHQEIQEFRDQVKEFIDDILVNAEFAQHLLNHAWLTNTENLIEEILEDPGLLTSMMVFLKKAGHNIPTAASELVADSFFGIPRFTLEWLETLLEGVLFPPDVKLRDLPDYIKELRRHLSRMGALTRRRVKLRGADKVEKTLKRSISKLQAILAITLVEQKSLGDNLQMVILTDYIRRAFLPADKDDIRIPDRLGVVPIFESIRRLNVQNCKLGILSGSLVVIPQESVKLLKECALSRDIDPSDLVLRNLPHDDRFVSLEISGRSRQGMVGLVTELFTRGGLNIIVGTKSLLGEGWDAPSINTLVLASFVGSYMLSNQMRGRAIRTQSSNPKKTANIWHLICIEKDSENAGDDFETMVRRFKAFVGVSVHESVIENGIQRLGLGDPPFTEEGIKEINATMSSRARNRTVLRRSWDDALSRGDEAVRIVEDIKAKKIHLPRGFVFRSTLVTLFREVVYIVGFFLAGRIPGLVNPFGNFGISVLSYLPMLGFLYFLVRLLPKAAKAFMLFVRHGPVKSSMKQIGKSLLATLCDVGIIRTDMSQLRVIVEQVDKGGVFCHIEGGTKREQTTYLNALREILDPIGNPRYLLVRISRIGNSWVRKDYHSVPTVLGIKKRYAERFAEMWRHYVGDMELIYTRNREGRIALLKARNHSLSAGFRPRSERISRWK